MERDGGKLIRVEGEAERFIADVAERASITRPLKVIAACGNGTAGAFAVDALQRMGVSDVIGMDTELDYTFPKYNPNPEDVEMLHSMAAAVREHGADLAMLDRNPGVKLSDMRKALPLAFTSLTMSPDCGDKVKYGVLDDVVKEY